MKKRGEKKSIKNIMAVLLCLSVLFTDITQYLSVYAADDAEEIVIEDETVTEEETVTADETLVEEETDTDEETVLEEENISEDENCEIGDSFSWVNGAEEDEFIPEVSDDEAEPVSYEFEMKYAGKEARKVLKLVNNLRKKNAWYTGEDGKKVYVKDLKPLTYDYGLEEKAMERAAEIAIIFDHTRPDGTSAKTAYPVEGAGSEIIGMGQNTAETIVKAWKEEDQPYSGQEHRRVLLSEDYNYIGVGHVVYQGYHYWVVGFSENKYDTTVTVAWNEEDNVSIVINDEYINKREVINELENGRTISITTGEKRELPGFSGILGIKGHKPLGNVEVAKLSSEWKISDKDLADIADGILCGKKTGEGELRADVKVGDLSYGYRYDLTVSEPVGKDLSKAKVSKIPAQLFDEDVDLMKFENLKNKKGLPIELKVKLGKEKLQMGVDYTVSIRRGDRVGKAELVLTSTGIKSFGTKTVPFKIEARNLKKLANIEYVSTHTYTGDPITPGIKIVDKKKNTELVEGRHFTVTFSKNVSAGTGQIVICGNEAAGYTGKVKKSFKIQKCSIFNAKIGFSIDGSYKQGGPLPEVTVTVDERVLVKDVDYKIKWRNTKKEGATPEFMITGKGSYCGKTPWFRYSVY